MNLTENVQIIRINDESHPVVTNIVNRFGFNVTMPAHSVMFVEVYDADGYPIYEFVGKQFINLEGVEEGAELRLESSADLDSKIQNRVLPKGDEKKQYRVTHIVKYFRDKKTGEPFACDLEQMKNTLRNWGVDYDIGIHDRDVYTSEDERAEIERLQKEYRRTGNQNEDGLQEYAELHQWIFSGNQKPRHIHAPIAGKRGRSGKRTPLRESTICNKLNLPPSCLGYVFDNAKNGGDDGFLDACRYLTHETEKEQAKGKFLYPDECFFSNVDWRELIEERDFANSKYGIPGATLYQKWKHDVMKEGKTLRECREEDWDLYSEKKRKLIECREDYLLNLAPVPMPKFTFYIEAINAEGGEGKSICTRSLAKVLAHQEYGAPVDVPFDQLGEDYIYVIGDSRVAMQHYTGQPIVIFDDTKAGDLISAFGSRMMVKKFLDMFQETKVVANIKNGSVCLLPKYIIINGIDSYDDFILKLAQTKGERENDDTPEDKALFQYHRRIFSRLIIDCNDELLSSMMNLDVLEPSKEKQGFMEISRVRVNFRRMKENLTSGASYPLEERNFSKAIEKKKNFENKLSQKSDEVTEEFEFYGCEIPIPENYFSAEEALKHYREFNPVYELGSVIYTEGQSIWEWFNNEKCMFEKYPLKERKSDFLEDYYSNDFVHLYLDKKIYPVDTGYQPYDELYTEEELEELEHQSQEEFEEMWEFAKKWKRLEGMQKGIEQKPECTSFYRYVIAEFFKDLERKGE